jgi:hypothetical protein
MRSCRTPTLIEGSFVSCFSTTAAKAPAIVEKHEIVVR